MEFENDKSGNVIDTKSDKDIESHLIMKSMNNRFSTKRQIVERRRIEKEIRQIERKSQTLLVKNVGLDSS